MKRYTLCVKRSCYERFKIDFYSPTALKSYNLDKTMRYQLNVLGNLDFLLKGIAKMLLILFAEFANI